MVYLRKATMKTLLFLILLIVPFWSYGQMETADSTHYFWNWTFEGDSIVQYDQGHEQFRKGRLLYSSSVGVDQRGKPDTLWIKHTYDAHGKRLSSQEHRGFFSDCLRYQKYAYDSSMFAGYWGMDDRPEGFSFYEPCWVDYSATTQWHGEWAVRTAAWSEDTVRNTSLDSVRFDALERPLHIVRYSNQDKVYEETCSYAQLDGDSLWVQRTIWDKGRSMVWNRKYLVLQQDTVVVYDATRESTSDNLWRESFWIYNALGQQTAFLSKTDGREETKLLIAYDENGLVKEHVSFYKGESDGETKRWDWIKTAKGYEIFYDQDGQRSFIKSVEQQCGPILCKWNYASLSSWPVEESLVGKLDQLQLTGYTEYDAQKRVIFQQNYQDHGRLTYQARHSYSR